MVARGWVMEEEEEVLRTKERGRGNGGEAGVGERSRGRLGNRNSLLFFLCTHCRYKKQNIIRGRHPLLLRVPRGRKWNWVGGGRKGGVEGGGGKKKKERFGRGDHPKILYDIYHCHHEVDGFGSEQQQQKKPVLLPPPPPFLPSHFLP